MEKLTDTTKMEIALQECMKLFKKMKLKYIEKKDYEKAAKIRKYESMCKDALCKRNDEFLNIVVSKIDASITVSSDNLISKLGLLEIADYNIRDMRTELIKHLEENKSKDIS